MSSYKNDRYLVRKKREREGGRKNGREGEGEGREREIWQIDEYFAGASVD